MLHHMVGSEWTRCRRTHHIVAATDTNRGRVLASATFLALKELLCSTAVLRLPDSYSVFLVTTDWHQWWIGAILSGE